MKKTDLNHLSLLFKKPYMLIFLVWPDKVQHFPARQWTTSDYQQMLTEKLIGTTLFSLGNYLVATGEMTFWS